MLSVEDILINIYVVMVVQNACEDQGTTGHITYFLESICCNEEDKYWTVTLEIEEHLP